MNTRYYYYCAAITTDDEKQMIYPGVLINVKRNLTRHRLDKIIIWQWYRPTQFID